MATTIITRREWMRLRIEASKRARIKVPKLYAGCRQPRIMPWSGATVFPWPTEMPIIPREAWSDMIRDQKGSFLHSMREGVLPPHDQGSTNRCWAHGSVRAVELLRLWENQQPILLSPDSVAFPIEGTRDRGGWPEDACEQLASGGACPLAAWPEGELSPKNADKDWQDQALRHVLIRWVWVDSFAKQMTLALRRIPVAIPLMWWGHLVCQTDPEILGPNKFGLRIDNSWGADWGDDGSAVLDEESATTVAGAFAPISETFTQ